MMLAMRHQPLQVTLHIIGQEMDRSHHLGLLVMVLASNTIQFSKGVKGNQLMLDCKNIKDSGPDRPAHLQMLLATNTIHYIV